MLTEKEIEAVLLTYRSSCARRILVAEDVRECERALEYLTHDALIDEAALKGQSYDNADMPRGTMTSDPTARLAMRMIEGRIPKHMEEIDNLLTQRRSELAALDRNIRMMDGWIACLKGKEESVIRWRIIEGFTWPQIIEKFEVGYNIRYSLEGLKKAKKRALRHIRDFLGE